MDKDLPIDPDSTPTLGPGSKQHGDSPLPREEIDAAPTIAAGTGALASLDEALRLNPRSADAWNRRGNTWRALGNARAEPREDPREAYGKACADCERALELDPDSIAAYSNPGMAWTALRRTRAGGERTRHLSGRRRWLPTTRRSSATRSTGGYANKGIVFEALGRFGEAVEANEKASSTVKGRIPLLAQLLARAEEKAALKED